MNYVQWPICYLLYNPASIIPCFDSRTLNYVPEQSKNNQIISVQRLILISFFLPYKVVWFIQPFPLPLDDARSFLSNEIRSTAVSNCSSVQLSIEYIHINKESHNRSEILAITYMAKAIRHLPTVYGLSYDLNFWVTRPSASDKIDSDIKYSSGLHVYCRHDGIN